MKLTYKIFFAAIVTMLVVGCNLDINEDPNRVTETTVTGALIFPAAANGTGNRMASGDFTFLNNWLGYWAASGSFAIDATQTTYNISTTFGTVLWQNQYFTLFDLEQARKKSMEAGDSVTAAASMILSAMLWQDLVDIFNNIPYSQAFNYVEYPAPDYDNAQDIYDDLQIKLDEAISYMELTGTSTFATVDIIAHGDHDLWIKFANTLKLRLLIRQSEMPGFDATAEAAKIVAKGGVLQAGETISVNPGYVKEAGKQSPFFNNYGLTPTDNDANPSVRANNYFIDLLTANVDVRLFQYFIPLNGVVVGNDYGAATGNPLTSSGIGEGLAFAPTQDQWLFTSTCSLFLEAEAIERGWLPGDPALSYEAAIFESFNLLRVPDADTEATNYLAANPYPAGDIKALLFQKYVALCGYPLEAWSDLRRIGFDIIPDGYVSQNPGKVSPTIPIRLPYASNEYTSNPVNVGDEGTIDPFTSRIFWDVN